MKHAGNLACYASIMLVDFHAYYVKLHWHNRYKPTYTEVKNLMVCHRTCSDPFQYSHVYDQTKPVQLKCTVLSSYIGVIENL